MVVLHYTGMRTGAEALVRLCDPASKVSAHYVVEEEGTVHALVPEDKRAWHAGVSYWAGERDINSRSIGIEIVNGGHEFGYMLFPDAQIRAVIALCQEIVARHAIVPARVLGHSDVAPARKVDPGHLFPWKTLAEHGVGVWPESHEALLPPLPLKGEDLERFYRALTAYGYDPQVQQADVIVAFHRHFCPERFTRWDDRPAVPDQTSVQRLSAMC